MVRLTTLPLPMLQIHSQGTKPLDNAGGASIALKGSNATSQSQTGVNLYNAGAWVSGFTYDASDGFSVVSAPNIPIKIFANYSKGITINTTGQINANQYTSATSFTGTPVGNVQFDANGNFHYNSSCRNRVWWG